MSITVDCVFLSESIPQEFGGSDGGTLAERDGLEQTCARWRNIEGLRAKIFASYSL